MKKLLCIIAILLTFAPGAYAQHGRDRGPVVSSHGRVVHHPRRVVVVRPAHRPQRVVVVKPRHRYATVLCRDGSVRRARPGACAGRGGYRR